MKCCLIWVYTVKGLLGGQEGCSGESTRLPPMWPGFKSRRRHHMWVEFVVGSLLCSERFFSGYSGFPLSSKKPTFPNSNSTRNQVDEEPLCGCATSTSFLFRYLLLVFINKVFEWIFVIDICMHIRVLA